MPAKLMKKSRKIEKNKENANSLADALTIQLTDEIGVNEENYLSELDSLKEEEKQLLIEKRQLLDTLDQLQFRFDNIADRKIRLIAEMEKNLSSKQQKSENESNLKLFLIETWGPRFDDGLVFTVMAEDHVWAEGLVREWLNSSGRENHRIDKVRALVSLDVRAVVKVGAKLLDI